MSELILKLRLPSQAAWNQIKEAFDLRSPIAEAVVLGTLQHPTGATVVVDGMSMPEMADSEGFHVDLMLMNASDAPAALRPYLVSPEMPKHAFGGRELDAQLDGALAPTDLANLSSFVIGDLVPTDLELAEIRGEQRREDKEAFSAIKAARLAVREAAFNLHSKQAAKDAAVLGIKAAQAARDAANDAISEAQATKAEAMTAKDAAQAVIDDPNSTQGQKAGARDDKKDAQAIIDAQQVLIDEAQAAKAAALSNIAANQQARDALTVEIAAARSALTVAKTALEDIRSGA